jgi:hypothetical protein
MYVVFGNLDRASTSRALEPGELNLNEGETLHLMELVKARTLSVDQALSRVRGESTPSVVRFYL